MDGAAAPSQSMSSIFAVSSTRTASAGLLEVWALGCGMSLAVSMSLSRSASLTKSAARCGHSTAQHSTAQHSTAQQITSQKGTAQRGTHCNGTAHVDSSDRQAGKWDRCCGMRKQPWRHITTACCYQCMKLLLALLSNHTTASWLGCVDGVCWLCHPPHLPSCFVLWCGPVELPVLLHGLYHHAAGQIGTYARKKSAYEPVRPWVCAGWSVWGPGALKWD
jgi:hypothetical protein